VPTRYLGLDEVVALHTHLIEAYGGDGSPPNPDKLDAALGQPAVTWDGEDLYPTYADKAAVYLYCIAQNHPFVDGNKRTAWASALMFLLRNDCYVDVSQPKATRLTLDVVRGVCSMGATRKFFRRRVLLNFVVR
jgi:death on curing protein